MKKYLPHHILTLVTHVATCLVGFAVLPTAAFAQFEGKVVYEVEYHTDDISLVPFLDFFPKTSQVYFSGSNSRVEQNISGGGQQVYIQRRDDDVQIFVMRFMGETIQVVLNQNQLSKLEPMRSFGHTETEETKTILGIECKKTMVVNSRDTTELFFNDTLFEGQMLSQFKDLKGLILEYETHHNGLTMKFTAKELIPSKIPDSLFEVSANLKEVSFEDFARAFAYKKDS